MMDQVDLARGCVCESCCAVGSLSTPPLATVCMSVYYAPRIGIVQNIIGFVVLSAGVPATIDNSS